MRRSITRWNNYQTPALSFKLGSVDDFVRLFLPGQVRRTGAGYPQKVGPAVLQVEGANLPSALEVVVLNVRRPTTELLS